MAISLTSSGIVYTGTQSPSQASGSGAAYTLDDYEEGTWSPRMGDASGNLMDANPLGWTHGNYRKIGDYVWAQCTMSTEGLGSTSGSLRISPLPFTAHGSYLFAIIASYAAQLNITAGVNLGGRVESTYFLVQTWDATAGTTGLQPSEWTENGYAQITAPYFCTA